MRILITGIDGFFGRNLTKAWLNKYELIGIDLPPQLLDGAEDVVKWHHSINHIDLREDSSYYKELLAGVDVVIHLAARTRINQSWNEYSDYYNTNITASQSLIAACQSAGVRKFIYFSSSSVYGNSNKSMQSETDLLSPTNPYAVSKMAAEMALRTQSLKGETELIVVRPFTMYGDYMNFGRYSLAIAKFLKAFSNNEPLSIDGDGTQSRDFVHASDAIAALELIVEHGQAGDVYNIGTGSVVSIKTLADIVSDQQVQAPARLGAVKRTCADISRLQALGYKPKVKIKEWLTERVNDIKLNETQQ
jgi:UDP-glucose 4-epimerase